MKAGTESNLNLTLEQLFAVYQSKVNYNEIQVFGAEYNSSKEQGTNLIDKFPSISKNFLNKVCAGGAFQPIYDGFK